MRRIIYFFSMLLWTNCGILAHNQQPENTLIQEQELVDNMVEVDEITDFDLDAMNISVEDLDDLERDSSLSFSEKASMLFAFLSFQAAKAQEIAEEKFEKFKISLMQAHDVTANHIYENQTSYAIGLVIGAAATASLLIWLKPGLFFANPALPQ